MLTVQRFGRKVDDKKLYIDAAGRIRRQLPTPSAGGPQGRAGRTIPRPILVALDIDQIDVET